MTPVSGKSLSELIIVIGGETLFREAFAKSISAEFACAVETFPDVGGWEKSSSKSSAVLIVIDHAIGPCHEAVYALQRSGNEAPVIVFTQAEDVGDVAQTLRCGARGHVPFSTPLSVALKVIRLVIAGGVFVPADTVVRSGRPQSSASSDAGRPSFTPGQNAVFEALRKGKSNKLIASELGLSESSVKAHLRGIMKQLKVKNRTEAVVKLNFVSRTSAREAEPFRETGRHEAAVMH